MASLDIIKGDTESWTGQVKSRGQAVPINNSRFVFTVKNTVSDNAFLIQKTSDNLSEIEITDADNGVFVLYLDPTDTVLLSPGFYPYDIEITFESGRVTTLVRDFIEIKQDITTNGG